jgi:hypothetical protein
LEWNFIAREVIFSSYMPFYDSSKRVECTQECVDAISMIETILDEHPQHHIIIGGDFNTELKGQSPFDPYWKDLMERYNLLCCDSLSKNSVAYTYSHPTLPIGKWNDHFLVDKGLWSETDNNRILDEGDNTSDHLPIALDLELSLPTKMPSTLSAIKPPTLKWEKCTEEDKERYSDHLSSPHS